MQKYPILPVYIATPRLVEKLVAQNVWVAFEPSCGDDDELMVSIDLRMKINLRQRIIAIRLFSNLLLMIQRMVLW